MGKTNKAVILAAIVGVLASAQAGAASYRYVDLAVPGGEGGTAWDVNNAGQIVGAAKFEEPGWYQAALWDSGGHAVPLPSLGYMGGAYSINEAGQIAGVSQTPEGTRATLWIGGSPVNLGMENLGRTTEARAINGAGRVAGYASYSGNEHALTWTDGTMGQGYWPRSSASGINDKGVTVGFAGQLGAEQAMRWAADGAATPLPTLGGTDGAAYAINESDQIVGWAATADMSGRLRHAALWDGGVALDLGTLPGGFVSTAWDINEHGQVVGDSDAQLGPWNWRKHAVLWEDGQVIDLNSFIDQALAKDGWFLRTALGINDKGWIVGVAQNGFYQERAFLLVPIPEPQTFAMLAAGAGILAAVVRKRRARGVARAR